MPVLKQDRTLRIRHFREVLLIGLPFAALVGDVLFVRIESTAVFVAALSAAALLGGVGLWRQARRFRRFDCPTCGAVLRRTRGKPGGRISFVCVPCDTEWDTGFQESTG